eukprot:8334734-Pyramimonas_sp.AAC.1
MTSSSSGKVGSRLFEWLQARGARLGASAASGQDEDLHQCLQGNRRGKRTRATVDDMQIEIVPIDVAAKYLGGQVTSLNPADTEIEH